MGCVEGVTTGLLKVVAKVEVHVVRNWQVSGQRTCLQQGMTVRQVSFQIKIHKLVNYNGVVKRPSPCKT